MPADITAAIHDRWHPGMMLVLTDQRSHPESRTELGFVVMSDDTAA